MVPLRSRLVLATFLLLGDTALRIRAGSSLYGLHKSQLPISFDSSQLPSFDKTEFPDSLVLLQSQSSHDSSQSPGLFDSSQSPGLFDSSQSPGLFDSSYSSSSFDSPQFPSSVFSSQNYRNYRNTLADPSFYDERPTVSSTFSSQDKDSVVSSPSYIQDGSDKISSPMTTNHGKSSESQIGSSKASSPLYGHDGASKSQERSTKVNFSLLGSHNESPVSSFPIYNHAKSPESQCKNFKGLSPLCSKYRSSRNPDGSSKSSSTLNQPGKRHNPSFLATSLLNGYKSEYPSSVASPSFYYHDKVQLLKSLANAPLSCNDRSSLSKCPLYQRKRSSLPESRFRHHDSSMASSSLFHQKKKSLITFPFYRPNKIPLASSPISSHDRSQFASSLVDSPFYRNEKNQIKSLVNSPPFSHDWRQFLSFLIDSPVFQHEQNKFWRPPRKFFNKRAMFTASGDAVLSRSLREVQNDMFGNYILAPRPIIDTTQMLQEGVNCSSFQVTHQNHFQVEGRLRPTWLHNSTMVGACPTKYVRRMLRGPPLHQPAEVLEAQCVCEDSQCSRDGATCVSVKYRMPVWKGNTEGETDLYTEDDEELTLACVCAKNPSQDAHSIPSNGIEF